MRRLKQKLISSYGLLIAIILAVSVWGIYHLVRLGQAIDVILENNYKSIVAAEHMKDALERLDSSALFFIAGQTDKAQKQFAENADKFAEEFDRAAGNITEKDEDTLVRDIGEKFSLYKQQVQNFISTNHGETVAKTAEYFSKLEPKFVALKNRLDDLLKLNQEAMLAANDRAISRSWEAEVSMAMLALLALAVALAFAWQFTNYVVEPITTLTVKAKLIGEGDFEQHISINSKDEIGELATEFNRMAVRLRDLRQTEQWQLLLEKKKSDAVIDSIYEPVIVTDAQGHVTKINSSARDFFLRAQDNVAGDIDYSLSRFSAGEPILKAVHDAVAMQKTVAQDGHAAIVPIKLGETERSYRLRTTPVRDTDGRLIGAVTLLEDLTEIREVDKLKSDFITIASGKLRAPLRSLQLALHAVIEGYTGELNEQQKDMLTDARHESERLKEIIDDLLELSEIESGTRQLSIERLRPLDVARTAAERFQAAADARRVKLINHVATDLAWILADREALRRIFDNLLSNAIRHTGRDGEVKLDAKEVVDRVMFSVSDRGEGIPDAQLPTLFNPFVQIKKETSGGTGLGLALVKRLVETQGGQVAVSSRLGEGTNITFTLPIGGYSSARR
jgi:two-component system, NtrC family, sensor histidine kinase KinB